MVDKFSQHLGIIKEFENAKETINPYYDEFINKIKWIIPVLSEDFLFIVKMR